MRGSEPGQDMAVYYHTHWDREWYLPFRQYQVRLAEVVDQVLERLEEGVLPCFTLDGQTVVLDDYLELRPENRDRLRKLIAEERLSIGPWYVMPDEFLVGGESLIRNLAKGLADARTWGYQRFTGYLPDTFGHSADIPMLFRKFGIDSAVIWRGVDPPQSLFQWRSPNGDTVNTLHLTEGYFQNMLIDPQLSQTDQMQALQSLVIKLSEARAEQEPILVPVGADHMGPPYAKNVALLKGRYPAVKETTPDRYMVERPTLGPVIVGELTDNRRAFLLPGVYASRMYLKQANRRLEHRLVHQLEPLLAMTRLLKTRPRYPRQELALAWQTLILNHPHDSICGCSVDAVHRENEVRFDHVDALTEALSDRAMHALRNELAGPDDWLVVNTGDQPYRGVVPAVEDVPAPDTPSRLHQVEREATVLKDAYRHDTHDIPQAHLTVVRRTGWIFADEVPAFGVRRLPKSQEPAFSAVQAGADRLENNRLRVLVNGDGTLSVTDKATGTTYRGLHRLTDRADQGDSYNSAPVPGLAPDNAELVAVSVVAEGPLVGALELTYTLSEADMSLITVISLEAESDQVRFETRFVNTLEDHKLQVWFDTGTPVTEVLAESHFGTVERHYDPAMREEALMPVDSWKEIKPNTGPVQRFFASNGQAFITEGLCEYEVQGQALAITLMRAFSHLSKGNTGVRGAQAGPPFATPEGQCLNREFTCRYAWLPAPSESHALFEAASRFYGTVHAESGCAVTAFGQASLSLVQWDNPAVVASACYWLPDEGLILRLLNTSDTHQAVQLEAGFRTKSVWLTDFSHQRLEQLPGRRIDLSARDGVTLLLEGVE